MTGSAANMCVTISVVIRQMEVSDAIMQVVFPAVHYAHDYSIVIMQVILSFIVTQVTVSSYNL